MGKYSVVDLFAGAGGLSLGFMQTNKYDIMSVGDELYDKKRKIFKKY